MPFAPLPLQKLQHYYDITETDVNDCYEFQSTDV